MQRVAGSRYGQFSGTDLGDSVTPAICYRIANLNKGQRQVGSSAGAAPP